MATQLFPMLDPNYIDNPEPYWQQLREEAPLYWSEEFNFFKCTNQVLQAVRFLAKNTGTKGLGKLQNVYERHSNLISHDTVFCVCRKT